MARLNGSSGIVVATSIPPKTVRHQEGRNIGPEYQEHCIESWVAAGFRVLSLNPPEEIADLARRFPEVEFAAFQGDEGALLGRKTPRLNALLRLLAEQPESIVGIVNADILLEAKDWSGAIGPAVSGAIAVAQRVDMKSLVDREPTRYIHGYDLFFLTRKEMPALADRPFAMGVPWWDTWLPIACRLQGLRVNVLTAPAGFHLQHPTNYKMEVWRYMAKEFAEAVIDIVTADPTRTPPELRSVVALCRQVVAGPHVFEDIPPSLPTKVWNRLRGHGRRLPGFDALISKHHGQDATRLRLAEACIAAISGSSAAPDRASPLHSGLAQLTTKAPSV